MLTVGILKSRLVGQNIFVWYISPPFVLDFQADSQFASTLKLVGFSSSIYFQV